MFTQKAPKIIDYSILMCPIDNFIICSRYLTTNQILQVKSEKRCKFGREKC